jgi:hypothetical protein
LRQEGVDAVGEGVGHVKSLKPIRDAVILQGGVIGERDLQNGTL